MLNRYNGNLNEKPTIVFQTEGNFDFYLDWNNNKAGELINPIHEGPSRSLGDFSLGKRIKQLQKNNVNFIVYS